MTGLEILWFLVNLYYCQVLAPIELYSLQKIVKNDNN